MEHSVAEVRLDNKLQREFSRGLFRYQGKRSFRQLSQNDTPKMIRSSGAFGFSGRRFMTATAIVLAEVKF